MSVAGTYAEALYESAVDKDQVGEVSTQVADLAGAMTEVPQLEDLLTNPEIDSRQKKAATTALLADANPIVRNFVQVLIDRGRAGLLPEIAGAYARRVERAAGRIKLTAVTAVPLTDDLRSRLVERVRAETGQEVVLTEEVDPSIVGGLLLRTEGAVLDASVRDRLAEMRRSLTAAPVEVGVDASGT